MYEKKLKLKHNEIPAKINAETGEVTELNGSPKKDARNKDRVWFNNQMRFKRYFDASWILLKSKTNDKEYLVAHKLAELAKSYSSSLEPLNDETSLRDLEKILEIDRRSIKKILNKLFDEGVYGKFAITDRNYKVNNYWIFNPYLSFNGTHIDQGTIDLFQTTQFAPENNNEL